MLMIKLTSVQCDWLKSPVTVKANKLLIVNLHQAKNNS